MKAEVDGRVLDSRRLPLVGSGGEAEVFDAGGGLALKLFKGPGHPDVIGSRARLAAEQRLRLHQRKLVALPALPAGAVAPLSLARWRGQIVGYTMPLVAGAEPLARWAEPRRRREVGGAAVTRALLTLRALVAAMHRAGVVIGDLSDRNVLVLDRDVRLIDVDSVQFGEYCCDMYSEGFVDPLLCVAGEGGAPALAAPHRPSSDWYAFAVIVMRCLLGVGPYSGVFRPGPDRARIVHAARPLHRVTVFDPEVVVPRAALPLAALPDPVRAHLQQVFCEDRREPMPAALLADLRWQRCGDCGAEHARELCPQCRRAPRPTIVVRTGQVHREVIVDGVGVLRDARFVGGALRWVAGHDRLACGGAAGGARPLAPSPAGPVRAIRATTSGALVAEVDGAGAHLRLLSPDPRRAWMRGWMIDVFDGAPVFALTADETLVIATGGRLLAERLAEVPLPLAQPRVLGQVVAGRTQLWTGTAGGLTVTRAGGLDRGGWFAVARSGLGDAALPARGYDPTGARAAIARQHAVVGGDRAWLCWHERRGAAVVSRCGVLAASGELLALIDGSDAGADWLAGFHGACAAGASLFVPTDRGVVRVEVRAGRPVVTREFPDTAPTVDAACRLLAGPDGLYVLAEQHIARLTLTERKEHP